MNFRYVCLCLVGIWLPLSSVVVAEKIIPADRDTDDFSLLSLGPIGVRVETDHRAPRHPRSKSNSATVRYIFENSLAEKRLKLGDVIIGVNGKTFNENFSAKIAEEIDRSEGGDGKLTLSILRNNKKEVVIFKLDRIGSYTQNWPYECKKSARILRDACDWLVAHQSDNGRFDKGNPRVFVVSSVSGLAMLGCDPERYKKPLEKLVEFHISYLKKHTNSEGHYENGRLELWSLNYAAIFLAEYYLITNDKKVFSTLNFLNREIYHRQFHQVNAKILAHVTETRRRGGYKGDPLPKYWFGHGKLDENSGGYIHLGANVANACVAWSLLAEAGVDVNLENLKATKDYIVKACEVGTMGYAAQLGQRFTPSDAFGRTGTLGIVMYLDGERLEYSQKVNEAMKRLYPRDVYFSHATCVMGKAWGVMAIAQNDPKLFRQLMNECKHDFDLIRLSDGSFVSNPATKNRHGKLDLIIGGNSQKHRWTTAFNAMIYAIGEKRLRIAGGKARSSAK